jgi:hypothetical protein
VGPFRTRRDPLLRLWLLASVDSSSSVDEFVFASRSSTEEFEKPVEEVADRNVLPQAERAG